MPHAEAARPQVPRNRHSRYNFNDAQARAARDWHDQGRMADLQAKHGGVIKKRAVARLGMAGKKTMREHHKKS